MKTERGVMVIKDGLGWGVSYEDGRERNEGWIAMEDAEIHDPRFLKKPEDATWPGSHYVKELRKGTVRSVVRTTTVEYDPTKGRRG